MDEIISDVKDLIKSGYDYTNYPYADYSVITMRHVLFCKTKLLIEDLKEYVHNSTDGRRIMSYFNYSQPTSNSDKKYKELYDTILGMTDESLCDSFDYISNSDPWTDYVKKVFEVYFAGQSWTDKYKDYVYENVDARDIYPKYLDTTFEEFFELEYGPILDYISWKLTAFFDKKYLASLKSYKFDDGTPIRDMYDNAYHFAEEQWVSYGNALSNKTPIEDEAYRIIVEEWIDSAYGIGRGDIESVILGDKTTTYGDLIGGACTPPSDEDKNNDQIQGSTTLASLVKIKMEEIKESSSIKNYISWFNGIYDIFKLRDYLVYDERNLLNPDLSDEGKAAVWQWICKEGGLISYLNLLEKNSDAIKRYVESNNVLSSYGISATFSDVKKYFNTWQQNCFKDIDKDYKSYVSNLAKNIGDNDVIINVYNIAKSVAKSQWLTRNSSVKDDEIINGEAVRLVHLWVNADKNYTIDILGGDKNKTVKEIRDGHPSTETADESSSSSGEQTDEGGNGEDGAVGSSGDGSSGSSSSDRKYIKKSVDTALGKMAYVFQLSQFVTLMPKPSDFVNKISNDVSHLMSRLLDVTNKLSQVSDSYAKIPKEYLMTNINSMFDSAAYIVDKTSSFAADLTDQTLGVVNDTIDSINSTVSGIGDAITGVGGSLDNIRDMLNADGQLSGEYIDFAKITTEEDLNTVNEVEGKVQLIGNIDTSVITDAVESAGSTASNTIEGAKDAVVKGIEWISSQMSKLVGYVDLLDVSMGGGGDGSGRAALSDSIKSVSSGLVGKSSIETSIASTLNTTANAIDKISIVGIIESLAGIATYSGICALGLDKLPPIDFVAMLAPLRSAISYDGEITKSDAYKDFERDAMAELRNARMMRDAERRIRKEDKDRMKTLTSKPELTDAESNEMKSIEDRITERKKMSREAVRTSEYVSELKEQFEYIGSICNDFAKKVKTDWNESMHQYRTALSEIAVFFKGVKAADSSIYAKSEGAKYISDCCGRIDADMDDIVEQCKNIGSKITTAVAEIPVPTSIGPVFDMIVYKILCFFTEVKTVVKFVFELINDASDILIQVNNLANIMLNGINSLTDVVTQIMNLLNIQWIFDLIQTLKELIEGKMLEGKALLENTISPVYFKDTEEYETLSNQFDDFLNPTDVNGTEIEYTSDSKMRFSLKGYTEKNKLAKYTITSKDVAENNLDAIEKMESALEQRGDNEISYYMSPILNDDGTDIIGYHYYYNNVDNYFKGKTKRKFKNRLIKRAARSGAKAKGGVNFLKNKTLKYNNGIYNGKTGTAYDAFYWYTKYTNDPTDYAADMNNNGVDTVGKILGTSNGSLVELENGDRVFVNSTNVNAGDIITVNGMRYRVV